MPTPLLWQYTSWGSMSPWLFPDTTEEQLQHWFWIHTVLIPVASCLLLLVLIVLLVRMER